MSLVLIILLILIEAVFLAAISSIRRANPSMLEQLLEEKRFGARFATRVIKDPECVIRTSLFGLVIAGLALGGISFKTLSPGLFSIIKFLFPNISATLLGLVGYSLCLIFIGIVQYIFGVVVPRGFAFKEPEKTLCSISTIIFILHIIISPFVSVCFSIVEFVSKPFGVSDYFDFEYSDLNSELKLLASQSRHQGIIEEPQEAKMLQGLSDFSSMIVREVMTPRVDMVTVPMSSDLKEILKIMIESGYSRFPVVEENVDEVVGVILVKDFFPLLLDYFSGKTAQLPHISIKDYMRTPYFVPSSKPIKELLAEFKSQKIHLAIVLDEHGGVDGIATIEDLVEEIVGEIYDESDVAEKHITKVDDGSLIVSGSVLVSDLNEQFFLGLPEGDYDTIAGFVFSHFGKMAKVGEGIIVSANEEKTQSFTDMSEIDGEKVTISEIPSEDYKENIKTIIVVNEIDRHRIGKLRIFQRKILEKSESESIPPTS